MPLDNLSEQERLRLAQLMKAPLLSPDKPARKPVKIQWPKWDGRSPSRVLDHFKLHWRLWAAGSATALSCLLLLAGAIKLGGRGDRENVNLRVGESQGQLQIRWDTGSDLVRRATGAKLFISDGAERLFVNLDSSHLQRGAVRYARQSGRVELRMALTEPDGRTVEQNAIFFGAPPPEESITQLSASAVPAMPSVPPAPISAEIEQHIQPPLLIEHRSRKKPLVRSGITLPFTCAAGDVFHKTDAPPGWDTFTCRGKNVWSIAPAEAGADRSGRPPSPDPNHVTVQPASASTT